MKQVTSFAKYAGIALIAVFVLMICCNLLKDFDCIKEINLWIGYVLPVLFIAFSCLAISYSEGKSAIRTAAVIILVGFVCRIVAFILHRVAMHLIVSGNYDETDSFPLKLISVSGIFGFLYLVGIVIGFLRLSRNFAKGSMQRVASILFPLMAVISVILFGLIVPWFIKGQTAQFFCSVCNELLYYGAAVFFCFAIAGLKQD